jgi:hypothetical protein
MEAEGRLAGLRTTYFGRQKALASGTTVPIDVIPAARKNNDGLVKEYQSWLKDFKNGDTFKVMIQQKSNTDAAYQYPDKNPEPLTFDEKGLTPAQQASAAAIERALTAQ